MKRGKKGDKFAPRTFILSHNIGELSYFIKADDKKPKATIKVANLNVSYSEKTHKNGLQLTYLKGGATRSIFVYHEEENTKAAVDWFLAIRATKLKHLQIAYPTKRPEELADYLTIDFMKEGYLWKKGPRTNDAYRKRYVVLDSRKLMYLDSRHDAFPLGEIYLGENSEGYTVSKGGDTNSKTYPHGLVLMTPERTWHFGSETEEDRDSWIEALNRVIQNLPQEYSVNLRHNLRNSYAFKKNRGSSGSGGRSSTSSGSGPHNIGHKSLLDALTPSRWSNKSS
ncbi:Arf-GAP with dual PH domain-containing protein 1 [Halotydeus destructor]|nr:Arf-GAP with dual PH domain-containing protein 1 [Halotydeus destructor]